MSTVRRLTFKFPTVEVNTAEPPDGIGPPAPIDPNLRRFETDFPFIFDTFVAVVRPPESLEELSIAESEGRRRSDGRYSDQSYFIGMDINGIVVDDGVPPDTGVEEGINAFFAGTKGIVEIDTTLFPIGVADTIKIVVTKATTFSPWLYYGLIPERAKLASDIGRDTKGLGAIFPLADNELIEAVGMSYFVDANISNIRGGGAFFFGAASLFVPFASGSAGASADAFFTADVIDGDGGLAYRSSTSFKIVSQTLTGGVSVIDTVAIGTATRGDSFRSINSKPLEYNSNTYKFNQPIKNVNYFISLGDTEDLQTLYQGIAGGFDLVGKFINLDADDTEGTVKFSFSAKDFLRTSDEIKESFNNPTSAFSNIVEEILGSISLIQVTQFTESDKIPASIVFVDTQIFDLGEEGLQQIADAVQTFLVETEGALIKMALLITGFVNQETLNGYIAQGEAIFGDGNVIVIKQSDLQSLGGLGAVRIFLEAIEKTADENDLVEEQIGVDANSIKENNLLVTGEASTSGTDYDRDGIISIIDNRLYEMTTRYRPTSTASPTTFLSTVGEEMRFWRKIVSIGQLYSFSGTVLEKINQSGGNFLLKVQVVWPDPEDENQPDPETNIINVYVEHGATSNLSNAELGDDLGLEFQGRMFFPSYMIKTSINDQIDFGRSANAASEIAAWFRVFTTTARDMIDFGISNPEEPLLVIRSNYVPADSSTADTDRIEIPPIFEPAPGESQGPESYYSVAQKYENVNDHINLSPEGDDRILITDPIEIPLGTTVDIFDAGDIDITFGDVEFDIILPDDAVLPSDGGQHGNFYYVVSYTPKDSPDPDRSFVLDQLYSVTGFTSSRFKFNPTQTKSFICNPVNETINEDGSISLSDSETEYQVPFPYIRDNNNQLYRWTWTEDEWEVVIKKNNIRLNEGAYSNLNPATATFTLNEPVNPNEDVIVADFINISGGQRLIKTGSKISITLINGPANVSLPKIGNVQINFPEPESVEGVDAHFSSTLFGDSFYLTSPAQGMVSLSGYGWLLRLEDSGSTAGGAFGARVQGDLLGPILFFDAFAANSDLENKIIKKRGDTGFPAIDVVSANIVNTFGTPFMEVFALLFEVPPPPVVDKVASFRSRVTERLTLVNTKGNTLEQRFSFTDFLDIDTDNSWDYIRKNLRRNVPIYSQKVRFFDREFTEESDGSVVFNIFDPVPSTTLEDGTEQEEIDVTDKVLVELALEYENDTEEINTFQLSASSDGETFDVFGYKTTTDVVTTQLVAAGKRALVQLPDTDGLNQIKLTPSSPDQPAKISAIKGGYINSVTNGLSPSIMETAVGEYILFFSLDPANQEFILPRIFALISNHDCRRWHRPGSVPEDDNYEVPIVVLNGFTSPFILKSILRDVFHIFIFNQNSRSIELINLQRALFNKINEDKDPEASDADVETTDEQQSTLVLTEEVKSYERVFKDENHIKRVWPRQGFADPEATELFSAMITKNATLFLAVIDSTGRFHIVLNRNFTGTDLQKSSTWVDIKIDLLDENSQLAKVISAPTEIQAITLGYDEIARNLKVFISTSDKLFHMNLPESILTPRVNQAQFGTAFFLGEQRTALEIDQYLQDRYNEIAPSLVVGTKEGFTDEIIELINANENSTPDDFVPQIISNQWLNTGEGQIYYLGEDGDLKSRRSKRSGRDWKNYENV